MQVGTVAAEFAEGVLGGVALNRRINHYIVMFDCLGLLVPTPFPHRRAVQEVESFGVIPTKPLSSMLVSYSFAYPTAEK